MWRTAPERAAAAGALILALETSCDDTCAAVVTDDGTVRSNAISSQGCCTRRYGGVVPEIASRDHLELGGRGPADALERQASDWTMCTRWPSPAAQG